MSFVIMIQEFELIHLNLSSILHGPENIAFKSEPTLVKPKANYCEKLDLSEWFSVNKNRAKFNYIFHFRLAGTEKCPSQSVATKMEVHIPLKCH